MQSGTLSNNGKLYKYQSKNLNSSAFHGGLICLNDRVCQKFRLTSINWRCYLLWIVSPATCSLVVLINLMFEETLFPAAILFMQLYFELCYLSNSISSDVT